MPDTKATPDLRGEGRGLGGVWSVVVVLVGLVVVVPVLRGVLHRAWARLRLLRRSLLRRDLLGRDLLGRDVLHGDVLRGRFLHRRRGRGRGRDRGRHVHAVVLHDPHRVVIDTHAVVLVDAVVHVVH